MAAMDGSVSGLNSVAALYNESRAQPMAAKQGPPAVPAERPNGESAAFGESPRDFAFQEIREEGETRHSKSGSVEESVREANQSLAIDNRSLRFRVNQDYGELQVQIVDSSRDKVIRSIPSDEMMRLAARMKKLSGVGAMVDESR